MDHESEHTPERDALDELFQRAKLACRLNKSQELRAACEDPRFLTLRDQDPRRYHNLLEDCVLDNAPECADILIGLGWRERSEAGDMRLLGLAGSFNRLRIAQALLMAGWNPNDAGEAQLFPGGQRPLISLGSAEFLALRLRHGADPNHRGPRGEDDPLLFHARDLKTARILLEAGADPLALDANGQSLAERHRADGRQSVAELIDVAAERDILAQSVAPATPTLEKPRL